MTFAINASTDDLSFMRAKLSAACSRSRKSLSSRNGSKTPVTSRPPMRPVASMASRLTSASWSFRRLSARDNPSFVRICPSANATSFLTSTTGSFEHFWRSGITSGFPMRAAARIARARICEFSDVKKETSFTSGSASRSLSFSRIAMMR